ncbi:MAG: hypothetical protein K2F63_02565 [Muribaculaceae bacterium]|nr:hypothetical protein [Muribaculaceae bacterium]
MATKTDKTKKKSVANSDPKTARLEALAQAIGKIEKDYGRGACHVYTADAADD